MPTDQPLADPMQRAACMAVITLAEVLAAQEGVVYADLALEQRCEWLMKACCEVDARVGVRKLTDVVQDMAWIIMLPEAERRVRGREVMN